VVDVVVVVDGRELSWSAFGRLWSTVEGWSFRLEIVNGTEDG